MLNIKKVLTELSNKLSRHIYTADYVTNSVVASDWIGTRQIRKIGDLAVFTFNGRLTGNLAAGTEVTIAKINNDAYLPYGNMITVNIPTQDNKGAILLSIKTTGEIALYASSAITTGSTFARAQVAYFCKGGVISYLLHLTESLKSFIGRRWAYAEPRETADEAVRTGELSYSGGYGSLRDIDKREWYSVGDHPETAIRNAHRYSWILHRWNNWEQRNKYLCHENSHERGSACCQEQLVKRGIHQTASVLSCSGLAPAPERGWWCA